MSRNPSQTVSPVRRLLEYVPAAAWAGFLLYLGSRSFDQPVLPYRFPVDKVAHLGLYGVLGVLAVIGWRRAGRWPSMWLPLALALGTGLWDELRQRTVMTRSGDLMDLAADVVAVCAAFLLLGRSRDRQGDDED